MNTPETMQRERQAEQELLRQRAAQARTVQARPAPEIGEQQARRQARRPLAGMDEVIPLRSVQIAEELKQGAAKSLSKSERKSWQRQKEAELQAALGEEAARRRAQEERRAFLAPAFAMMDQMEQGIMDWREAHEGEKAEDGLAQSFAEDLAQRLQPAEALDLSALGAAGAPPEAAELSSMLTRLLDTRPADFTGEMAKEMNAQYKALPIPKAAVSDHLDDLAVAQPQANYFLLLHGAALSLQNHVERQAPEGVEQRQLSRLYAIAAASGLAAGAILSDPSYQKGRTEAAVAAEAKLETVRRREEWQQYIRTGQGTGETVRANWHLAPFSDPIWSLLEEEFPILREGGIPPLSIQDFSRRMERFNIALQENIAACNSFLRRQSAENPLLLKPDAAESLRAAMLQRLGRRALTEKFSSDPAAFAEAYQGVLETDASFREASDRYRERLNQLGASAAALRSFIRTDADVQRSLSDLDEEAFAEYAEQLRTQIEGNLEILDSAIAQNLPLIARAEARSAFIARFGATLLGGSPALVETAASSYTKRGLLSSLSHAAAQSARLLEQLLDEHMFVKSWQPLLDKKIARMTPEERRSETVLRDAIQELMSVVQRNEGSADELFRDRLIQVNAELLPAQWEALWETRRALLDTEDEDVFKSRLEEAIPPITAEKPAGAISYEAFLSGAPAAAAQKEQAAGAQAGGRYFAERLESGAFLNWEGFGGLLSGYADALPQALNGLLRQKDLTDIPGVDKIQSVADMDSQFSHMEFNRFLIGLRANVLRNLEAWNGCGLLREQLLPALLRGLPPEDFQGEAKKLQAELEDEARAQDLRFATTLLGESQEAGPVQYTYTASTKSSAWRGESSRPQRRLARFESAASLRQGLQEAGLLDAALAAYRQALKIYGDKRFTIQADCNTEKAAARQKHSDNLKALASAEIKADNNRIRDERKARATLLKEPFRKSLKSLLEGAEGRIEPGEYKRLNDLVNKLAGSADYTLEFGLGGFEDLVLNDGAGRQAAFTSQEREVYESALDEMPQRIDARVSALRGILDRFPESTFAQRREDIMANMRGMVVNLPDTLRTEREEDRVLADRNELRYGAKTWTEALMKLQMTLLTGTSEETRTQAGFSAQAYNKQADILKKAEIASAQQERRLADLRSRSDGIFAEIIPFLLRRREDARILSVGDDESFRAYASALEERLSAPLELLSRQLPFHRQQIYREYGDVLADPRHKASAREWRPVFDSYVRQIDALETGSSPSIDKWIARASSSFIAPYVMELLLADASLISGSEDQINQKLFVAQGRIQENLKALNDLCAGPPNVTFFSSAAQREGFRQFLRHEIALEKAGVFSSRLADRLRDFKARVSTDARQVRQSSEAMEEKARAAAAIDQEKLAGYNAWSRMNEPLAELKENMRSGVSPLALQLNAPEAETPNQERVEATRKALTLPPYASYSAEVNSALLEHSLLVVLPEEEIEFYKNKPENKKKKNKAALELDLAIARLAKTRLLEGGLNDLAQRLKEGSVQGLSALPAERAAPFLLYVSLCGALVERKYPDEQVARLYEDFAQKLEALHDLRALAQKGAVLEQGDTTLAREHKEAVGALAYGFYHLARKDFCDSVHTQLDYFTRSAALIQQIGAVLEEAQIPATRCAALNLGFRYYFQARLLGASLPDPDALGAEMRALLEDRAKLEFIEAGDFEKTEIDLFDQRRVSTVGYLSRELTPYTLANREDLADFLSRSDEGRWKQHGALTAEQRQLFGLVLGVPGILREADEILPSMAPVYSEADRRAAQRDLRQQVEAYINREAFNPVVDYATALRQLRDSNGELDGAVFDTAMQFTQLCIQRRQAKEEKDWDRLANPMESVAYRGGQTRVRELSDMPMENRSHLMDALRRKVMAASESGARKNALSLLKKADALNPAAFALLVRVLQDRTMIDRTTGVSRLDRSKGAIHGFANEDARQEVKEQYLNDEAAFTASSASLRRALFTLHSYQLRDDQKLTTGYLQAADFADGALARREDVDWSLLERALDFVKEMHREGLRLQVIQQATSSSLIEQSPNEKVRALYEATGRGASVQSREALEEQLLEQADADGQLAALAGYHALEAPEKALLIKALARRDILDVSKQDIYLNRFGYMERDYANPRARDALIDQYFNFPGDLENLQAEDFTAALRGCLSSQVYDRTKSTDLTAALGAGDAAVAAVLSKRGTAIDWKLFGRALQLVRRAQNERKVFEQERELYRAQGDVEGQGAFRYNAHFARKNVHNAGNRFTRFVGRRASAAVMEEIPAPFLKLMRVALPLEVSNQINSMEPLKPEESDLLEHIDTVAGLVSDFAGMEAVGAGITHIFSESVATNLADSSGYVSTAIGVIGDVKTVVESTVSKKKLRNAREEGREVQEKDDARTEAAEKEQSEEERELAREASARNVLSAEMGLDKASQRMNDELINAMASLVSAGVGVAAVVPGGAVVEKLVEIAIREAGEFINFLRNYFNDIESIEKYFEKENKVLPAYRAKLGELMKARGKTDEQVEAALRGIKVRELACDALGFENYTELASFVGLNITRSLLFCAGKQNPQLRTQIQAKAALAVIDCEEAIGKQDDESALQVYNAIMGGKYR